MMNFLADVAADLWGDPFLWGFLLTGAAFLAIEWIGVWLLEDLRNLFRKPR